MALNAHVALVRYPASTAPSAHVTGYERKQWDRPDLISIGRDAVNGLASLVLQNLCLGLSVSCLILIFPCHRINLLSFQIAMAQRTVRDEVGDLDQIVSLRVI